MSTQPDTTGRPQGLYLSGPYEPVADERDDHDLEIRGTLPAALDGTYMRNGANPAFPPIGDYHIFDGDGMIHAITLGDGRASYRNRFVESAGLALERRRGKAVFGGLSEFTLPPEDVMAEVGPMKNTANTNIIRHNGTYLALMEAAPPTEITERLETVGPYDFGSGFTGSMTAHPRWDPATGDMHFFGMSPFAPFLQYHVCDADGRLTHSTDIPIGRAVMMHDFVITERHAVFFDLPATFSVERMMSGEAGFRWEPDLGARIGVLPLSGDGADIRWIEVDPFYVFHFLNAYETESGEIIIDACRSPELPTSFGDDPQPGQESAPSLHRFSIAGDHRSARSDELDSRPQDFPRIDERFSGRRARYGFVGHAKPLDVDFHFDGVIRYDLESQNEETYIYGDDVVSGEAVFAPNPQGTRESQGWLLNIVTDNRSGESSLVILDAEAMSAGPVAEVVMKRRIPFGFHGNWMAA